VNFNLHSLVEMFIQIILIVWVFDSPAIYLSIVWNHSPLSHVCFVTVKVKVKWKFQ